MPQLSVSLTSQSGLLGMLADLGPKDIETVYSDDDLPFAVGVLLHASATESGRTKVKLPAGDVTAFRGIVAHSHLIEQVSGQVMVYVAGAAVSLVRKGRIWVVAEQDVSEADAVYLRHTVGAGGELVGNWRKDVDGGKAAAVAAYFRSSATAGNPVLMEVNLP